MKILLKIAAFWQCLMLLFTVQAKGGITYTDIDTDRLYVPVSDQLSLFSAQALTGPILSLYMVHAAQKYNQLFNDTTINRLPLKDRSARIFVLHPANESDTLYQIDIRIYSPSYVGRRYNRMIIIRPYDQVKRPCILYTHGNNGNLNTWSNYYMTGAASMLERGYAIAFYENYNNSNFIAAGDSDPAYKDWKHKNLVDSTQQLPEDHLLQRGHYLLYQYAYAAHVYLTDIADEYRLDKEVLFTAGHSAGGLSSMQLTFANPATNFRHPVFEYCGAYNSRKYPEIEDRRIPVKGVFCSAAGLQDETVKGSYIGKYFDADHRDKVVIFVHGATDPLAPVNYGPALWSKLVDTVKMMGPLSLHAKMDEHGIRNFSFINCIGVHGVYSYPKTMSDNSGVFRELSPFSYDYVNLSNEDFFQDKSLYQLFLYHQQMDSMVQNVAGIFSRKYLKKAIDIPSSIYTWEPAEFVNHIDNLQLSWIPKSAECGIQDANIHQFYLSTSVPTRQKKKDFFDLYLYPNPAQDRLFIQGLNRGQQIGIFDIMGKKRLDFLNTDKTFLIDIDQLENGAYFLIVNDAETQKIIHKKFIVNR